MPEVYDDMVQCDECEEWFHLSCVGLYRHHLLNLNGIVANAFSWVTFCTIVYFL